MGRLVGKVAILTTIASMGACVFVSLMLVSSRGTFIIVGLLDRVMVLVFSVIFTQILVTCFVSIYVD